MACDAIFKSYFAFWSDLMQRIAFFYFFICVKMFGKGSNKKAGVYFLLNQMPNLGADQFHTIPVPFVCRFPIIYDQCKKKLQGILVPSNPIHHHKFLLGPNNI